MHGDCVFGVYIDLEDIAKHFDDEIRKKDYTLAAQNFKIWSDKFIEQHKRYSNVIGAEYEIFGNDWYDRMVGDYDLEFIDNLYFKLNLVKFYAIEHLVKKYNNVLYLDLDVVPITNDNFFEFNDTQRFNCIWNFPIPWVSPTLFGKHLWRGYGPMSNRYHIKKRFTKQMYLQQKLTNFTGDSVLVNTGVIGTSSKPWNTLRFFDKFVSTLRNNYKVAKSLGNEYVDWAFEGDTMIGIKHQQYDDSKLKTISDEWNYAYKTGKDVSKAKFVHLISKTSFDSFFKEIL